MRRKSLWLEWVIGGWIATLLCTQSVHASDAFEQEVNNRISRIQELATRLEFDANRVNHPSAYRQALAALSGSVCAAATFQQDFDANLFSLSAKLSGEAEAQAPLNPGVVGFSDVNVESEVSGGTTLELSGLVDFSGGITHRLCINPVPWAVALYYKTRSSIPGADPFPELIPNEVFLGNDAQVVNTGAARRATAVETAFDSLSPDARNLLLALGNQVFEGLDHVDNGSAATLSWFDQRVATIMSDVGVSAGNVADGVTGLGDAIGLDYDLNNVPAAGDIIDGATDFPQGIAALIPFAPQVDFASGRFLGVDLPEDLNYCQVLSSGNLSARIPFIHATLDTSCDTFDSIYAGAPLTVAGNTLDLVEALPTTVGILEQSADMMSEENGHQSLLNTYKTLRTWVAWVGDNAWNVRGRLKQLSDDIANFF